MSASNILRILGLFQKRIEGDDSLLRLAALRFEEAGMGAELHAGSPEELERIFDYLPPCAFPVAVHLPRDLNPLEEEGRAGILAFASRFEGHVFGLVLHDQSEAVERSAEYLAAIEKLDRELVRLHAPPLVFIEYAVFLEPGAFAGIFKGLRNTERIGACVDTGHIGLYHVRETFKTLRPDVDVFSLAPHDPRLPEVIGDVEEAVRAALPGTLKAIKALGETGKPLHFHLHDAHPLYDKSPLGISDHLSFLGDIPIPFEHNGRRALDLMYGPYGLKEIIGESLAAKGKVSCTLEIHPTEGRVPLGDAVSLFGHWRDLTNAERMDHWLTVLKQNHRLLSGALRRCGTNVKNRTKEGVHETVEEKA
jgi:hypothetical protein